MHLNSKSIKNKVQIDKQVKTVKASNIMAWKWHLLTSRLPKRQNYKNVNFFTVSTIRVSWFQIQGSTLVLSTSSEASTEHHMVVEKLTHFDTVQSDRLQILIKKLSHAWSLQTTSTNTFSTEDGHTTIELKLCHYPCFAFCTVPTASKFPGDHEIGNIRHWNC